MTGRLVAWIAVSGAVLSACGGDDKGAASGGAGAAGNSSVGGSSGSVGADGGGGSSGSTNTGGGAGSTGSGGSVGPTGTADFEARCAAAGVVRCVGFDAPSDLAGGFGDNHGTDSGNAAPELDLTQKASGQSSIRFTIPSNSSANSSGSYFTNFSDDLTLQFDENSTFYVQWRQRFSAEFITTHYQGGGGWKHIIIGVGDRPGCSASAAINIDNGGNCASSCTELETVVQNTSQRGFAQMYNSCTGSASHGAYDAFEEAFGGYDFKLQNARPSPYCLYSQGQNDSYFPPQGNCAGYFPDEWMTFQVQIETGPRQGDEFKNSHVRLWIAREGQKSELALDWGPYNLTAGAPSKNLRFGKVWLLPYHTGKDSAQSHATAYTWYDELIVSTNPIADPA